MFKIYKVVLFSLVLVLLNGCGGGDGNSNSSTTYPSRQAFVKFLTTTANFDFTASGSIGGFPWFCRNKDLMIIWRDETTANST